MRKTKPLTRRQCERQVREVIRKWRDELGLQEWQYDFHFEDLVDGESGDGGALATLANVDSDDASHMTIFRLNACLKPEYYEGRVVHEWLHVRWRAVERAIRLLTEPAQTVVYDAHHAALNRVARALVGERRPWPWGKDVLLERPPWVSVRG